MERETRESGPRRKFWKTEKCQRTKVSFGTVCGEKENVLTDPFNPLEAMGICLIRLERCPHFSGVCEIFLTLWTPWVSPLICRN